tara:strand:+ start:2131 stop:2286 length:156 start_codon:yes stop_codon:yes gene_type:complete
MVLPFHMCGVISLVVGADKKGLKALKTFFTQIGKKARASGIYGFSRCFRLK